MEAGGMLVAIVLSLGFIAFFLHMLIEEKADEEYYNNDDDD